MLLCRYRNQLLQLLMLELVRLPRKVRLRKLELNRLLEVCYLQLAFVNETINAQR